MWFRRRRWRRKSYKPRQTQSKVIGGGINTMGNRLEDEAAADLEDALAALEHLAEQVEHLAEQVEHEAAVHLMTSPGERNRM